MYGDALTTVARVKDRIGLNNTEFDDFLANLILSTTARIQLMCGGRRFVQATYTNELHDGSDFLNSRRTILILKNGPVQAVTSVQYKAGLNSTPSWTTISADLYDVDYNIGAIIFYGPMPQGRRNMRVTYTGGYSGYTIGLDTAWVFNITPTGDVDGSNLTFTLPETADQVIVYVDGVREAEANVTFTADTNTFTLAAGRAPYTVIAVDYLRAVAPSESDYHLPADLVDVCERAVVHLFKKRDSEGRASETFDQSSITWEKSIFNDEMVATIKNYRRGYDI